MRPRTGRFLALALAALGLLLCVALEAVHVATYLRVTGDSFCTVGDQLDCRTVALSELSVVLGIPLPVWGIAGFAAMLAAATNRSILLRPLASVSAAASVALLLASALHVGAFCILCEAVHLVAVALAVVAWRMPHPPGTPLLDRATAWSALGVPTALLVSARLLIPSYWSFAQWTSSPAVPTGVDEDGNRWMGAEQPVRVLHEFVDYGCPHCATSSNRMKMRLADGAPVRVVRRHQPRNPCTLRREQICTNIRAAYCAGQQGKFWEMDSWLFAHVAGRRDPKVQAGAVALQLDLDAFDQCLMAPQTWTWAATEAKRARGLRILDTPTYLIDGEKYPPKAARAVVDDATR